MFRHLNEIIENEIKEPNLDFYSVIVGTKPSVGARSPKLWNKVYKYEEKKVRMVPLDVEEGKIEQLFNYLKQDKHCLGGAVAVPFKETEFSHLIGSFSSRGRPLASMILPSKLFPTSACASLLIISTEDPGPMPVASLNGIKYRVSF